MASRMSRGGSALVTCMIVLVVLSTMAVSLAALAGANLEIADNQRKANGAFASSESGLEVMRYWLSDARVSSDTPPAQYLSAIIDSVRTELDDEGITNFVLNTDGSIPVVPLETAAQRSFLGQWSSEAGDPSLLNVAATGSNRTASRTIIVQFRIEPYRFPIFNYGIATKGALRFPRNPTLTGTSADWEADIYVESGDDPVAVQVGGNASFDGKIDIGNPLASVDFQGDVRIGDDYGQTAIDENVTVGADPVEFPVPDVTRFRSYATGPVLDSTYSYDGSGVTLTNAVIAAGTNPTFTGAGSVTIQGILYIEAPNIVTFGKNVDLYGMIAAEGQPEDLAENGIHFQRNFSSGGYPSGSEFDAIRQEQGSSILAPGSAVSFIGNFSSVNGVLAAGSLYFASNADAVIKGTMISYSPNATVVDGNISMDFDRAAMVEIPAGFDLYRVPIYDPTSYTMVQ